MGPARPRTRVAVLTLAALVVVTVTAVVAVLSDDGGAPYAVTSVRGETVQMYGGAGPYAFDTVTKALMQRAFDTYYLAAGIPIALIGLTLYLRGRPTGRVLLASSLLFLVYALLISSIGIAYNDFFLAYLAGLILSARAMVVLTRDTLAEGRAAWLPTRRHERLVAILTLVLAAYFVVTWLVTDIEVLVTGAVHPDLEIYTTAEQNVTDLALFATVSLWAALAALRRRPYSALFCTALVLMAGQTLVALTVFSVGASGHPDMADTELEWPLPIAAAVCLGVGLIVLRRLHAAGQLPESVAGGDLDQLAARHPVPQRTS